MCLLFVMVNGFFEPSLNGTIMEHKATYIFVKLNKCFNFGVTLKL